MTSTACELFQAVALSERVALEGRYLNRRASESIEHRLRNDVEGVCSRHGYIRPGSIRVHTISPGTVCLETGGKTVFTVDFDADVCNPTVGSRAVCRVEAINSFAAFATNASGNARVLEVIVAPDPKAFVHEVPFEEMKVGSLIVVRLVGKRFHLGQKTLICAGQLVEIGLETEDSEAVVSSPNKDDRPDSGEESGEGSDAGSGVDSGSVRAQAHADVSNVSAPAEEAASDGPDTSDMVSQPEEGAEDEDGQEEDGQEEDVDSDADDEDEDEEEEEEASDEEEEEDVDSDADDEED